MKQVYLVWYDGHSRQREKVTITNYDSIIPPTSVPSEEESVSVIEGENVVHPGGIYTTVDDALVACVDSEGGAFTIRAEQIIKIDSV
jgi:hypothetical protein